MELRFRKSILFLGLLSIFASANLFSQEEGNAVQKDSNEHVTLVRTYNIRKIYSHRLGYRIDVFDYQGRVRTIYAKTSWFANPEERDPESDSFELAASMKYLPPFLRVNLPPNYLTLKYEGGKLVAMVIYVDEANYSNNSLWARMPTDKSMDSKFDAKTVVFSDPPSPPAAGSIPEKKDTAAGTTSEPEDSEPQEEA